jgi:hypothetical protein
VSGFSLSNGRCVDSYPIWEDIKIGRTVELLALTETKDAETAMIDVTGVEMEMSRLTFPVC